jgi:hypothetical protein
MYMVNIVMIFINALLKCIYSPVLTRTFEYLRALSTVRIYRSRYRCALVLANLVANNFYFIIFVWCLGNVLPVTENLNGAVYTGIYRDSCQENIELNKVIFEEFGESCICEW